MVNKLENEALEGNNDENRDYATDVDEFIEASELVHNAVKEIRNALLMNRNPEDVDSDNEYEEGIRFKIAIRLIFFFYNFLFLFSYHFLVIDAGTNYPDSRNQVSDVENEQKIMRRLPEEDKRKIQEQIDVFKV